ncbi:hypothetical protein DPMN_092502 [Dreissena polymorpha]|uniref:Uncharacterized protein n=1 Tax=Dreissena polymorpha TaxID=45954 RepID=A0A9D4R040_DREPO|nr:hypothetical protein DPMN_092502 [Dreissena polymorpha]
MAPVYLLTSLDIRAVWSGDALSAKKSRKVSWSPLRTGKPLHKLRNCQGWS